eukprot:9788495-Ditylum_brightwellii.AAC.1
MTTNAMVSSASSLTALTNQTLQDILQQTEVVEIAFQNKNTSLQQLHDTTTALQTDNTVQDNMAKLCKQTNAILKNRQTRGLETII